MTYRKKLIEVALPLEAINMESAREQSIRHGKKLNHTEDLARFQGSKYDWNRILP